MEYRRTIYTDIITEIVKREYIYKYKQIWYKYNGLHAFAKWIVFDKVYKIYNILCATSGEPPLLLILNNFTQNNSRYKIVMKFSNEPSM